MDGLVDGHIALPLVIACMHSVSGIGYPWPVGSAVVKFRLLCVSIIVDLSIIFFEFSEPIDYLSD